MQTLIHNAVHKALTQRPERRLDGQLWVSDLGRNPYAAARRLLLGELAPFDYPTLMKMDGGSALEDYTLRQVAENLEQPIKTQFPLFNAVWTGYADLVISHNEPQKVMIYDHKGSAGRWWDYRESLPRTAEACQVWMYGALYAERYGMAPWTGLYYRGWGCWAEFEIDRIETENGFILRAKGVITDEKGGAETQVVRDRNVDPVLLRLELEGLHNRIKNGYFSFAELDAMDPGGPDWDYAETAMQRLR